MTTGNLEEFSVFSSKFSVSAKIGNQENFESSEKNGAAPLRAAAEQPSWRRNPSSGPLPNNLRVLQDVESGLETTLQGTLSPVTPPGGRAHHELSE